ncbi:mitochondrial 28S ribosomal protein S18A, putative [Pediculus humanus corporis]|uniref:Mitochondrial 28S ribosomal protein S18A, putative n=1 Tax=Pediculus humanus subsp. corporis TaxID=121224 RepID=E0VPL2_PEDHC|nr:mitochondrial 28S ribosomal protein S18A, putative [Pediculus humanus corporis]EEB15318.1 mitochondrial 28S ribosomal protein S18A, putative [Pediculus humanus corporis]
MIRTILRNTINNTDKFRGPVLKNFHISAITRLKEIVVSKPDEKTTVIEGKYVDSPRVPFLIKHDSNSKKCILCQLQLNIKHTDVLILSQFITSEGEIMQRRDIGICKDQYRLIKNLIYMAQHSGLLPAPPRISPKKPYHYLKTYYDEKTINIRPKKTIFANKLHKLKLGPIEKLRVRPEKGVIGY